VLLIMGLGAQLIGWPDELCAMLAARGLEVIRFDNRDVGESTHFTGTPNFMAVAAGDVSTVVYTLSDMAADTAGLLDALGIASAHVVGASMGGFIAQTLAIEHPARVRSLTSIMSSTGDRTVGQPHPEALALFAAGTPRDRDDVAQRALAVARVLGSPAFPPKDDEVIARAQRAYDRGFDPSSYVRQGCAVIASGDRTPRLRSLSVPTLVIHGSADKMCDVSGGRATAAAIPGAELVVIDGMGHDLPRALWPRFVELIASQA
jgi:pimeloyl-ACP methyl ester carboxylesterase